MSTIPLVHDLRQAALAAATGKIAAYAHAGVTPSPAAVQASLDVAAPYLADATRIEDAIEALLESSVEDPSEMDSRGGPHQVIWKEANGDLHAYIRLLHKYGELRLCTLQFGDDPF